LGGTPKSPSNASQVSTLFGSSSQQSQAPASFLLRSVIDEAPNREQEQLLESRRRSVVSTPPQLQAQGLPSSSADEPLTGQMNLLNQAKSIDPCGADEGSLDSSHRRGRAAAAPPAAGLCKQQQALGGGTQLRNGSPNLPLRNSANAPTFSVRNRSADNIPFRPAPRLEGLASPSTVGKLQSNLPSWYEQRAQSLYGAPVGAAGGSYQVQPGGRRTSASVTGQPLRLGMPIRHQV